MLVVGYIGSHAVLQLLEAGHTVTVIDNLSRGNAGALLLLSKAAAPDRYRFHQVDLGDKQAIRGVLLEEQRSDSAATSSRGQVSSKAASGDSLRTATEDGKQRRAARVILPRVDLVIHFAAIAYVGERSGPLLPWVCEAVTLLKPCSGVWVCVICKNCSSLPWFGSFPLLSPCPDLRLLKIEFQHCCGSQGLPASHHIFPLTVTASNWRFGNQRRNCT